jgi:hypothetical protein
MIGRPYRACALRECTKQMASYFLNLTIPVTLMLIGLGGYFLDDSISHPGPSQLLEVMGGASLLALGLIALLPQVRLALRWMQAVRNHHNRDL